MILKSKDVLVTARLAKEEDDMIMVTEGGMSIKFAVAEIKPRHRTAGGVKGMVLAPKDRVVAADIIVPDSKLLVISKNGYGKLTDLNRYRHQGRGGFGTKTLNITKKTGKLAAAQVIADSDEVYVVSEKAQVIRTSLSRDSQHRQGDPGRDHIQAPARRLGSLDRVRGQVRRVGGGRGWRRLTDQRKAQRERPANEGWVGFLSPNPPKG